MNPVTLFTKRLTVLAAAIAAWLTLAGCATPKIVISYVKPGDINLQGISKIAFIPFNSLPSDSLSGTAAADASTVLMAQRLIAEAFTASGRYQVVEPDIEKKIISSNDLAHVAQRYDAVAYGRIWWQVSPDHVGQYPQRICLESWVGQRFITPGPLGLPTAHDVHLTSTSTEAVAFIPYRSQNAQLMMTLTILKVAPDGTLSKMADTFAIANQNYLINNGIFSSSATFADSRDQFPESSVDTSMTATDGRRAEGAAFHWQGIQNTVTIPNELQTRLALATRLTAIIARRLVPTPRCFTVNADFKDDKLNQLFFAGAYYAAQSYSLRKILQTIPPGMKAEFTPLASYQLANIPTGTFRGSLQSAVSATADYLYALALCQEQAGDWQRAQITYRFIFQYTPSQRIADGLGRCADMCDSFAR